ncbi:ABC transporter transmembrane domain-containing protein [Streptomyces sp. NPDC127033]|uniref:ABC transporter transmembrane domain-containing protein n=1 Tax=Streptomyces sp. NPDC127033 TaxID=3347110 RepID=UPI0036595AE8
MLPECETVRRTRREPGTGSLRPLLRDSTDGQLPRVLLSSLLLAVFQTATVLVPVVVGMALDTVMDPGGWASLLRWSGAIAAVFAAIAVTGSVGSLLNFSAELTAAHLIRLKVVRRILAPSGFAEPAPRTGELTGTALRDTQQLAQLTTVIGTAVPALSSMTFGFLALLSISAQLAAVMALGATATMLLSRLLSKRLVARIDTERDGLVDVGSLATDLLTGLRTLKGVNAETWAVDQFRRASRRSVTTRVAAIRWESAYKAMNSMASGLLLAAVIWMAGSAALDGAMTVGQLVGAVGLVQAIVMSLDRLAAMGALVARASSSHQAIRSLLMADPRVPESTVRAADSRKPSGQHIDWEGELRLSRVRAGSLETLDLHIPAGTCVGVVSTREDDREALLSVLSRESGYGGSVLLNGTELMDLDLETVRRTVAVSRHDDELFPDTVIGNITGDTGDTRDTGDSAADAPGAREGREDVARFVEAALVDEIVRSLPSGLDTVVTERGHSLSGGQRQRVVLARALATEAPVLVLADPLNATDSATEYRVSQGIRKVRDGRTTIVLANSPALLDVCDHVVLIDRGTVVAAGAHAELSADPRYAAVVFA